MLEGRKKKVRCELDARRARREEEQRAQLRQGGGLHDATTAAKRKEREGTGLSNCDRATLPGQYQLRAGIRTGFSLHRGKSEKQVTDRGEPEGWASFVQSEAATRGCMRAKAS